MKRIAICFLLLTVLLPLSALAEGESNPQPTLIVYLSRYGNTYPIDDVDAVASASVQLYEGERAGSTEIIARMIAGSVNGDLFSLRTNVPYPANYREHTEVAQAERREMARPALATHIENMDQYSTIFLGFPNWWGDLPMPVYTFLEEHDLTGKTIIPFYTNGGSRISDASETIQEMQPDATVLEAYTLSGSSVLSAADDIAEWLGSLGVISSDAKIRFSFADKEIIVILEDNATSRDFAAMLPLTLTFSDYNSTEKVAYLENTLAIDSAPSGFGPDVGHLTYYAPWGNLAFFYNDFTYSSGLILMGTIDTGIELLGQMEGPVTISIVSEVQK